MSAWLPPNVARRLSTTYSVMLRCSFGTKVCPELLIHLSIRVHSTQMFYIMKEIYPTIESFNRTARFFQCAHRLGLELPIHRATHYRESPFVNCTACLWYNLPTVVFSAVLDVSHFQVECSVSSPHFPYNLS